MLKTSRRPAESAPLVAYLQGIPDLVEGYRIFREELAKSNSTGPAPQLIMVRPMVFLRKSAAEIC